MILKFIFMLTSRMIYIRLVINLTMSRITNKDKILNALNQNPQELSVSHLANLTDKVRSVFVMAQLTKLFEIHDSVNDGVELLNNS